MVTRYFVGDRIYAQLPVKRYTDVSAFWSSDPDAMPEILTETRVDASKEIVSKHLTEILMGNRAGILAEIVACP